MKVLLTRRLVAAFPLSARERGIMSDRINTDTVYHGDQANISGVFFCSFLVMNLERISILPYGLKPNC